MVPFFLPIVAGVLARGAAVVGRIAMGAGRAIASQGGRAVGRGLQRTGAAMQRYARNSARGAMSQTVRPGRRPVTPRSQAGGQRRRGRQRQSLSFSQAFRRAARQGARNNIIRQRRSAQSGGLMGQLFAPKSYLGRIAQNYGSAQQNFRQGNTLAGISDSAKVAGDVSKPVIATAAAMVVLPKLLKEWGASLIESKRHLGEFNATYSVAAGRLDIQRFQRNVRLGAATGGSFQNLTQAQNRLEERLAPYAIAGTNALLKLVTVGVNVADSAVRIAEGIAKVTGWSAIIEGLGKKFGLLGGGAVQNQPLADLGLALGRGNFAKRVKPPMPPMNNAPPGAGGI